MKEREPTERLAYVGPPLRRRTSVTCGRFLRKTKPPVFSEHFDYPETPLFGNELRSTTVQIQTGASMTTIDVVRSSREFGVLNVAIIAPRDEPLLVYIDQQNRVAYGKS